jgi:hypothetical protein
MAPLLAIYLELAGISSVKDVRPRHVGFLRLPVGEIEGVDITTVHTEPFVVVLPLNHVLSRSQEIRLQDLRGEKFVMIVAKRNAAPVVQNFCELARAISS